MAPARGSAGAEFGARPAAAAGHGPGQRGHRHGADAHRDNSLGELLPEASRAASSARADNVCLVRLDVAGCLAEVRSVVARAQTQAGAAGAPSNDGGTELMGVTVRHPLTGQPLQQFADTAAIGRNRRIPLEGLGYLVLNEQLCDHGVGTAPMCSSEHSSGLIVRAMHLLVTVPNNALGLVAGTELVVGDAHFGAEYRPIQ